jgi:N-acetylmuramoyl-L-alanine amidase
MVMIDPAHGGTESGAVLNPTLFEKDVNLAFARSLRQDLTAHGIIAELTRDSDTNLSTDDRAAKSNALRPLLYVCLHASSLIGSTKLFTGIVPETGEENTARFVAWNTAQAQALATSMAVEQQMVPAFGKAGLFIRALAVPMRPLNNVVTPAIAIELAPRTSDVSQLMSPKFQQPISAAIANGIAASLPLLTRTSAETP